MRGATRVSHDLRFAWRLFRSRWRFFALLWTMIALGLGVATATFGIARSLLWPPIPAESAGSLSMIWAARANEDRLKLSLYELVEWKAKAHSFEQLTGAIGWMFSLASPGALPEAVVGVHVTGDFFPMLRVQPLLGRFLRPEDDREGAPRAVVIAASLWHRRFGSEPRVVGTTIEVDGAPYTVVGVAPEGFHFSYPGNEPVYLWTPMAVSFPYYASQVAGLIERDLYTMARLRDGVAPAQAEGELTAIARAHDSVTQDSHDVRPWLLPLLEEGVGATRKPVRLVVAAVALLFLIVCFNVASLLITSSHGRRAEFALRAAFGATRRRLLRQLATETLLVFLAAAPGGALVAALFVRVFYALIWGDVVGSRSNGIYELIPALSLVEEGGAGLDAATFAGCLAACLAIGLCGTLLPALFGARSDLRAPLEEAAANATGRRAQARLRTGLLIGQIAVAFVLLTAGGSALGAFREAAQRPLGFDAQGLVAFRFLGTRSHYPTPVEVDGFYARVMDIVRARDGVVEVAIGSAVPLGGYDGGTYFDLPDLPTGSADPDAWGVPNAVTPSYFQTMAIPILSGRNLDPQRGGLQTVISKTLAERYFPGQNPIGQHLLVRRLDNWPLTIVGVAADVLRNGLARPAAAEFYTPLTRQFMDEQHFIVTRARDPEQLMLDLPALVAQVHPSISVWRWSISDSARATLQAHRILTSVLGAFALGAVLLATFGIYSFGAYATTQRKREFGIRLALGATGAQVLWLIVRGALLRTCAGLALGVGASLLVSRYAVPSLRAPATFDAPIAASVALGLTLLALGAALVPAVRSTRIPPADALRHQ